MKKIFGFINRNNIVNKDLHSLTIGATRSGKTRCLVLESINNIALSGENMIVSDPKRRTF